MQCDSVLQRAHGAYCYLTSPNFSLHSQVRALLNHHEVNINQPTSPTESGGTRRQRFMFGSAQLRVGWSPLMYAIDVCRALVSFLSISIECPILRRIA